MNEQALDLRRFLQTVWRQKAIVLIVVAAGLLAGIGYTLLHPPLPTSTVLVLLPSSGTRIIGTQVVIASSDPVLAGAADQVRPAVTLPTLRNRVKATGLTSSIISISAQGETGAQAQSTASAVAHSYIDFIGRKNSAVGKVQAEVLSPATAAAKGSLRIHLIITGAIGLLLGVVFGAIMAVAIGRNRRPLRQRSEIARAAGAPVLASVLASHPAGPAAWARLLEQYRPGTAEAVSLRRALRQIGFASAVPGQQHDAPRVVAVISLASDPGALAVGPQLAVFAAASGIPTTLIISRQDEGKTPASLRAAITAAEAADTKRPRLLTIDVMDTLDDDWRPATSLTVVVSVASSRNRALTRIMPATTTLLAVSAGVTTGEQLARIAARIAATGHHLVGAIVADPDEADDTTGRLSRPAWLADRLGHNGEVATTTEIRL